jgi:hypothetical protein
MAKMKKEEIAVKFAALSDAAKELNIKNKNRRFLPMSHVRHSKLQEFGLYDYVTKRYTLGSIHSGKAQTILKEMREMLSK